MFKFSFYEVFKVSLFGLNFKVNERYLRDIRILGVCFVGVCEIRYIFCGGYFFEELVKEIEKDFKKLGCFLFRLEM